MNFEEELISLRKEIAELRLENREVVELRKEIAELRKSKEEDNAEKEVLRARIKELEELLRVANDKLNKNSSNSSKPPSSDFVRTKSLRIPSIKTVGGQKGHKGSTLEKIQKVDDVIVHHVELCSNCGANLQNVSVERLDAHQVFDMPVAKMKVTEHQIQVKDCPHCKTKNKAVFPAHASQPTQYGNNLKAFICYLSNYQIIPYKRTSKIIMDLFEHRISESTIVKFNNEFANQLTTFNEILKEYLITSHLLHFDETGYYYSNQRNWLHVACNEFATYYYAHPKRGKEAMLDMGILEKYLGNVIHDFWKSYMDESFKSKHYLCNVHHLRDLKFCEEQEKSNWAKEMASLLLEMKKFTEDYASKGFTSLPKDVLDKLITRYDELIEKGKIEHPLPEKDVGKRGKIKKTKSRNLLERFEIHKESVLGFVKDFSIPFGNNAAEQALRMMKVQQKISGCFRSGTGAEVFAKARSYIETMRKNNINIIDAIGLAINGNPVIPFA